MKQIIKKPKPSNTCKICKKELKKINAVHIKTHDIIYEDYMEKFEPDYYYFKILAEKLLDLYYRQKQVWIEQGQNGKYFECTSDDETGSYKRNFPLNNQDIEAHLLGRKTVGVKFINDYTHMFGLDLDFKSEDNIISKKALNAFNKIMEIINVLKLRHATLPSYSGSKGFHIDIFLEDFTDVDYIEKFYGKILEKTGYTKNEVELRGGKSNLGYKLPLGLHQVSKNWCDLKNINEDFIHFQGEHSDYKKAYETLCRLNPITKGKFIKIINNYKVTNDSSRKKVRTINSKLVKESQKVIKNANVDPSWKKSYKNKDIYEKIEYLKRDKLKSSGTRNNKAFVLGNLLAQTGLGKEEIFNELKNWHFDLDKKYYDTDQNGCFKEYRTIAENAIKRKDWTVEPITYAGNSPVLIADDYVDYILKPQAMIKRRIMFALLSHAKAFLSRENTFYMTYNQINTISGTTNNRGRLKKHIQELQKQNLIEIVKNNIKIKGTYKKHANYYKIPGLKIEDLYLKSDTEEQSQFARCSLDNIQCKNCFLKSCNSILSATIINENFSGVYRKKLKYSFKEGCPKYKSNKQKIV